MKTKKSNVILENCVFWVVTVALATVVAFQLNWDSWTTKVVVSFLSSYCVVFWSTFFGLSIATNIVAKVSGDTSLSAEDRLWVLGAYLRGKVLRQKNFRPKKFNGFEGFQLGIPVTARRVLTLAKLWGFRPMTQQDIFKMYQDGHQLESSTPMVTSPDDRVVLGHFDADGIRVEDDWRGSNSDFIFPRR